MYERASHKVGNMREMVRREFSFGSIGHKVQAAWVEYKTVLTNDGLPCASENSAMT